MSKEPNSWRNIKETRMMSNGKLKKIRRIGAPHAHRLGTRLLCDLMPRSFKGAPNTTKGLKFITDQKSAYDLPLFKEEPCTRKKKKKALSPLEQARNQVLEEHSYFLNKKHTRQLQDAVTAVGSICDDLQNEVKTLQRIVKVREKFVSKFHKKLVIRKVDEQDPAAPHRLTWGQFSKNPAALEALTGFDSQKKLQKFMNTVRPLYNFNRAAQQMPIILPLEDQIFLVLTYFRFGFSEKELMQKFNMTVYSMERTLEFWLELMDKQLTRIRIWPKRLADRPRQIIIDSAKVFMDCVDYHQRERTLLGLTPDGVICFISDMYSDDYSEVEVAEKCGILKLIEPGDEIFADDAFLIGNFIKAGVKLSRPRDARRDPIRSEEIIRTKNVAERVIGKIKGYKILEKPHLYCRSPRIFKICCHLVNFGRDDFLERKIVCN